VHLWGEDVTALPPEGRAALGLGRFADAITRAPDGHYEVADPAVRAAILRLA